ncbi:MULTISPECIES: phenylpyruvate tautomerase MIF-related protein [Prochlorococcus]|uniref:phenylpyruvate tautomerase MIF-related protein n=1 Tax=Prochlorococcus TaxID=1218 RepID=UPI0005337C2E|nr:MULTISPECIES: phenylpyruvate tautomerase MIF-related protein [Prochlorococcus]KGG12197.1 putative ATLS1-like light-inducible protein [Prochlorococcus sp. MIT 0601]
MPLINLKTSITDIKGEKEVLKALSSCLTSLTGKPEKYVMVTIQTGVKILFGGNDHASCHIEVRSIGSLNPSLMSQELCELIHDILGIEKDRIYINFEDVPAKNWGYNGSTFG